MEAKKNVELSALQLAYKAVRNLNKEKYTHARLVEDNFGFSYKVLRRIARGKAGRQHTDRFYLRVFFNIINSEYERQLKDEGTANIQLLSIIRAICKAMINEGY